MDVSIRGIDDRVWARIKARAAIKKLTIAQFIENMYATCYSSATKPTRKTIRRNEPELKRQKQPKIESSILEHYEGDVHVDGHSCYTYQDTIVSRCVQLGCKPSAQRVVE